MFISQSEVRQWFSKENLDSFVGPSKYSVENIGRDFLLAGGHRWRPWLCVGVFEALTYESSADYLKPLAMAIECFHKASLIHDDIEDDDKPNPLHRLIGVPQALNAGDYLIHLAYSLIQVSDPYETPRNLIAEEASITQLQLCCGQGEELATGINNFAHLKTVPMFQLAFESASLCANIHPGHIREFCQCLGETFQSKDDLEDGCGNQKVFNRLFSETKSRIENFFTGELQKFLSHYINTMFGQSAAIAAASSADIAPAAAPAPVPNPSKFVSPPGAVAQPLAQSLPEEPPGSVPGIC